MNSQTERLYKAIQLLENACAESSSTVTGPIKPAVETRKKRRSLERERQACQEIRDLLAGWESLSSRATASSSPQFQRHELSRAVDVLFGLLDHREQSLRFAADQTLDAIFRKFVLRFLPQKVIAFLLTELSNNKKPTSARAICAALSKLSWVIGHTRAHRAGVYTSHFLAGISLCLQRPEESVQSAVERQFPVIIQQLGPHMNASLTEKAVQLYSTAVENLSFGGVKSRAASTVISQLAKFVPTITHKAFYQLSKIILEADDKGQEQKNRLVGSLIAFRQMLPTILECFTESSAQTLQKLLCKLLCCLHSQANDAVVASLELLQKFAAIPAHCQQTASLGKFNPLLLQRIISRDAFSSSSSPLHSPPGDRGETAASARSRNVVEGRGGKQQPQAEDEDAMSVCSMRTTGTSASAGTGRAMSAWSSMDELIAGADEQLFAGAAAAAENWRKKQQLGSSLGSPDDELTTSEGEAAAKEEDEDEDDDTRSCSPSSEQTTAENGDDDTDIDEDNFSVISAEIFVDPLMNRFHEQQKTPEKAAQKIDGARSSSAAGSESPKTRKTKYELIPAKVTDVLKGGSSTPRSTNSRGDGSLKPAPAAIVGIPDTLPEHFCSYDDDLLNFWSYSALCVANHFLLAGPGGKTTRSDREVRVSHKILALDYIGAVVLKEPRLIRLHSSIRDDEGNRQQPLTDLYAFIGHEDDNLAISALNFALNLEKCHFFENPTAFQQNSAEKNKIIWHLKKTLHSQQQKSAIRTKGILQSFVGAIPLLCTDEQLLAVSCEYALKAAVDCDYVLVKAVRAEFFSRIQWARTTLENGTKLQPECMRAFLRQLFDSDPRVQKATMDALATFVQNAEFGQQRNTSLFASISLPNCLVEGVEGQRIPMPSLNLPKCVANVSSEEPCSLEQTILAENLARTISTLYAIAMERFSERQPAFFAALATLMDNFPPTNNGQQGSGGFASAWLTAFGSGGAGISQPRLLRSPSSSAASSSSTVPLPNANNLLSVLLECAECNIGTLDELSTTLRLVGNLFSAITEALIAQQCSSTNNNAFGQGQQKDAPQTATTIPMLWGDQPQQQQSRSLVERTSLLFLRTFNLYYSIAAEERLMQHQKAEQRHGGIGIIASGAETIVSSAASIIAHPSQLLQQQQSGTTEKGRKPSSIFYTDSAEQHQPSANVSPTSSTKASSLSFLLGTGVKQTKLKTSYTQSAVLKALEAPLRGAYRAFIENLDPSTYRRFLEPFDCLVYGFCSMLEMADLEFVRPFLNELLIYLRMLIDVSSANSALLVHHLLKCLFNSNEANVAANAMLRQQQSDIWHQHLICTGDPVELYLSRPLNNFTVFATFVGRTEFSEWFTKQIGGWLLNDHFSLLLRKFETEEQCQEMNQLLHLFSPFITHLLKYYLSTNSVETRKMILQCISHLCLCNVQYDKLDRNGKFRAAVMGQLKQLSPEEDVPLLPSIFAFLCILARFGVMKFTSDLLANSLAGIFSRLEPAVCPHALGAVKVVLLEVVGHKLVKKEAKEQATMTTILTSIRAMLTREFALCFQFAPEQSAEVWILLLHAMRHCDLGIWSETSLTFMQEYAQFCVRSINPCHWQKQRHSPQTSPSREFSPPSQQFASVSAASASGEQPSAAGHNCSQNHERLIFLKTTLLCQCAPESRSSDLFFECLQSFLTKVEASISQPLKSPKSVETEGGNDVGIGSYDEFLLANLAIHLCPMLFVLLDKCKLAEQQTFLAKLGGKGGEEEEDQLDGEQQQQRDNSSRSGDEAAFEFVGRNIAKLLCSLKVSIASLNNFLFSLTTARNGRDFSEQWNQLSLSESALLFLLFTIQHAVRAGKSQAITNGIRENLQKSAEFTNRYIQQLALLCSPAIWAHWSQLQLTFNFKMDFSCGSFSVLPVHCKQLLVQLITEHVTNATTEHGKMDNLLSTDTILSTNEDFLLHLLRLDSEKLLKSFVKKLPANTLEAFIQQLECLLCREGRAADGHLPRFLIFLSKSENQRHSNLLARLNELENGLGSVEALQIIRAYLRNEPESKAHIPAPLFNSKEMERLKNVENLSAAEFYQILAGHATTPVELQQIASGICHLGSAREIGQALERLLPWPRRRAFYERLFFNLRENAKIGGGKGQQKNSANCQQMVLEYLLKTIANAHQQMEVEEKIYLLANIGKHLHFLSEPLSCIEEHFPFHVSPKCVHKFLNANFVPFLSASSADGNIGKEEELPLTDDFFKALKLFFCLSSVKAHYGHNDCTTLRLLLPFLDALWEQIEREIPRWRRFHIDRQNWPVQVHFTDHNISGVAGTSITEANGEELAEAIQKLFSIVQSAVFALKNKLIPSKATRSALQAILAGVSLLQRMALVPELALRQGWPLNIEVQQKMAASAADGGGGRILIPLIQIHMLNDVQVLQDFCWRVLFLGWTSRAQFEEFCMSLYGVLSSTPTTSAELQQRAAGEEGADGVYQQLTASSLAIEALTNILLQTALYPQPGTPVQSHFLVQHRKRLEQFSFLESDFGQLALRAKALTNAVIAGGYGQIMSAMNADELYVGNMEILETNMDRCYGLGQVSVHNLRSSNNSGSGGTPTSPLKSIGGGQAEAETTFGTTTTTTSTTMATTESASEQEQCVLPTQSSSNNEQQSSNNNNAELMDTTASSLRALFETFMHWLKLPDQLPLSILQSTLRSLALLSDLFRDRALYKETYATVKLLLGNMDEHHEPISKGYTMYLLMKCAAVLDWTELADNGEITTERFIEQLVHDGMLNAANVKSNGQFVRICTLHGLLYLLQSPAAECLQQQFLWTIAEFVLKELQRMAPKHSRTTDTQTTDFSLDLTDYHRLCWAVAFALLQRQPEQQTVGLGGEGDQQFLQLVNSTFVDPRSPGWLKKMLTRGVEQLALQSCSFAPRFRQMALECLETYQLQPDHLPFALSIYATCAYRELGEGNEFVYEFNKTFGEDFQKLLNIFSFYNNDSGASTAAGEVKAICIAELTSDLISQIWAKEAVLECIFSMLMPTNRRRTSPKKSNSPVNKAETPKQQQRQQQINIVADFVHPLQQAAKATTTAGAVLEESDNSNNDSSMEAASRIPNEPPLVPAPLILNRFDQALMQLLHLILTKLLKMDRCLCYELANNYILPRLLLSATDEQNTQMSRCLALVLFCSVSAEEEWQKRIQFLIEPQPMGSKFSHAVFPVTFLRILVNQFFDELCSLELLEADKRDNLLASSLRLLLAE